MDITGTTFILSLITKIDIALCVIFFFGSITWLLIKIIKITSDVKDLELGQKGEKNENLCATILEEYKNTAKGGLYTSELSSNFINLNSIDSLYKINLRLFYALPSVLTGLGILGTFFGLVFAVKGFDSSSSEGIQMSINTLLEGMSTAFITSVVGMGGSLLFLLFERIITNILSNTLNSLCSKLDKQYHCSIDYAVIKSFSFEDEEGNLYLPSESLQSVQESVKNMRKQLETFGTDICDNIGNALDNSFQEKLVPIINELSAKLENPAQAVTDSLIKELQKVCDDFSNNVTQGVSDKMEDLLERFIDASNAIETLPDTVNEINKSLSISTKDTVLATQAVTETLHDQILQLKELTRSFFETLTELSSITVNITELHKNLESIPQTISETSTAMTLSAAEIKEAQNGVIQTIDNIKSINDTASESIEEYTHRINTIQEGLSSIFNEISEGINQYKDSVQTSLQDMLDPFTSSVTDATEKVANAIAPLNDTVTDLSSFNDSVRVMLSEVQKSFKPIETILKQLSEIRQQAAKEVEPHTSNNA